MNVTIELSDDIAKQLDTARQDMPRGVLKAVAVEGYRSGALTRGHVQQLLNLSCWKTEAFLKERQAYLQYDEANLEQDRAALTRAWSK